MPQTLHEDDGSESSDLSTAARELLRTADELRSWRAGSCNPELGRLESLQGLLTRIDCVDMDAAKTRRAIGQMGTQPLAQKAVAEYEQALHETLQEIGELERLLEVERTRLSPRVDSAARESEARTAYARSLTRT
jgi:hypothetical protein